MSIGGGTGARTVRITGGLCLYRRSFSNADYVVPVHSCFVAQIGVMSAPRAVSLPDVSIVGAGKVLTIYDESGTVTAVNELIVNAAAGDTINGAASRSITSAYGRLCLIADDTSRWTVLS